jgi:hypothetical protein
VDSIGSGQRQEPGFFECGVETSVSGATELVYKCRSTSTGLLGDIPEVCHLIFAAMGTSTLT